MELWKALAYLFPDADPLHDYILRDDGDGKGPYISEWQLSQPKPTSEQIVSAIAAFDNQQSQRGQEAQRLRQQVVTTAQSVVGFAVGSLSAAQVRALLAVLLHKEGALDKDGKVRPLVEWVKG